MSAKVTYFDMSGLGEPVRYMLGAANIPFQDVRIGKEEWALLKPKLRWPHLPMLEMDGLVLFQSRAISRYIATKGKLRPEDPAVAALTDSTVDSIDDMRSLVVKPYYTEDSPERDAALSEALQKTIPLFLTKFEEQVKENGGFLVGGKLSWADVMLVAIADYIGYIVKSEILAGYFHLSKIADKVKELPGVSRYLATRPEPIPDFRVHFM